jgi:hypothetical protein
VRFPGPDGRGCIGIFKAIVVVERLAGDPLSGKKIACPTGREHRLKACAMQLVAEKRWDSQPDPLAKRS